MIASWSSFPLKSPRYSFSLKTSRSSILSLAVPWLSCCLTLSHCLHFSLLMFSSPSQIVMANSLSSSSALLWTLAYTSGYILSFIHNNPTPLTILQSSHFGGFFATPPHTHTLCICVTVPPPKFPELFKITLVTGSQIFNMESVMDNSRSNHSKTKLTIL